MRIRSPILAELGPVFRAAHRRRSSFLLMVVEVALGVAGVVLCLQIGLWLMGLDYDNTGAELEHVVTLRASRIGGPTGAEATDALLPRLAALPGVTGAASVDGAPHRRDVSADFAVEPAGTHAITWTLTGTASVLDVLGIRVVEGRGFRPEDYAPGAEPVTVVTRKLAETIAPGKPALEQVLRLRSGASARVVGVVDFLLVRPSGWPDADRVAILAARPVDSKLAVFLLRTDPARIAEVSEAARKAATDAGYAAHASWLWRDYEVDADETAGTWVAGGVAVAMLVILLLGWMGTVSYLVIERTRQIGVRRALGATQGAILRYFLLENLVVTTIGIACGLPLIAALFALTGPKLSHTAPLWIVTPTLAGMILFWLVGLLAAWVPARRAARIPPIAATRTL